MRQGTLVLRAVSTSSRRIPGVTLADDAADRIAAAPCPVLITGETGSGKGHLARWLHDTGPRADAPFIPVNCGALPEGIIDSHLFGHVRGAFSDAHREHCGLVRAADRGTLFLDEVGELPASAQLRLLRLLEEREAQPVGGAHPVQVDVKIIAATACDLDAAAARGDFRLDLFYRLNVIHLEIDPLRDRPDDLRRLLRQFNLELAATHRRSPIVFRDGAIEMLAKYDWPGNVRELRTLMERLHVLCGETEPVGPDILRSIGQLKQPGDDRAAFRLNGHRLTAALDALEACGGNISRAAQRLGVHRSTVHRWLAEERMTA